MLVLSLRASIQRTGLMRSMLSNLSATLYPQKTFNLLCTNLKLSSKKLRKVKMLKRWKFAPTLDMFAEPTLHINRRSKKRRSQRMTRLLLILKLASSPKLNCLHRLKTVVAMLRTRTQLRNRSLLKKRRRERRRKLKSKRRKSLKKSANNTSQSNILKKKWKSI